MNPRRSHPSFQEYLDWLEQCDGRHETTYVTLKERDVPFTTMITAEGKMLTVADVRKNEILRQHTVDRFDRRLGIESPWNSWDEPSDEED